MAAESGSTMGTTRVRSDERPHRRPPMRCRSCLPLPDLPQYLLGGPRGPPVALNEVLYSWRYDISVTEKTGPPRADSKRVRVAIAQSAPVYLDKRASLAKALDLTQQAAKREAQLVAFGETWLPGYPAWLDVCPGAALWESASAKEVFARLRNNSISVHGEEVTALSEAARDLKIAIVIGANERVDTGPGNGTLYNSLLTISDDGELKNHHRKLVPTYTERLVCGNGEGRGLEAVPTAAGGEGGVICWGD